MKFFSVALLVCACAVAMASAEDSPRVYDVNKAPELFEKFIKDFERQYKDEDDKQAHYVAFVKNLATINESNQKNPSATYGINKFTDYTEDERKNMFGIRHQ